MSRKSGSNKKGFISPNLAQRKPSIPTFTVKKINKISFIEFPQVVHYIEPPIVNIDLTETDEWADRLVDGWPDPHRADLPQPMVPQLPIKKMMPQNTHLTGKPIMVKSSPKRIKRQSRLDSSSPTSVTIVDNMFDVTSSKVKSYRGSFVDNMTSTKLNSKLSDLSLNKPIKIEPLLR